MSSDRDRRLATYGTLAPGRANHHHLAHLDVQWQVGWVHGHLRQAGWGASMGYPGLTLDPDGPSVEMHLFESDALPDHWAHLDAFEGDEYRRTPVTVHTPQGDRDAWIYALAD